MTTPVITIVPTLDVATLARIRFPAWLQSLYNAAQLQCTELDICGALHFVALDPDWDGHPSNINATTPPTIRARPTITMPRKPAPTATGPIFARFVYDMAEFTKWEKARTSLHAAIVTSLGPATVAAINSAFPAGISSLSCKKLVEYVAAKSEVTTDEITIVEKALHNPLTYFADFPDFIATLNMNYSFLNKNHYTLPPLMQIQLLVDALQAFPQFLPYITIYNEKTPMQARTYDAFSTYLMEQFTNMPKEASTRGGHAYTSYKGKGKKGKNKGKKGKRKWKWDDNEPHTGHRAEKRARSISPSPSVTPSILLSPSMRHGYGVDKTDTRSMKSHRSSAHSQIHSWKANPSPTPNEHDTNPDPDTYFYCYVHGFNLTHSGPQCAKMRHDPTDYTTAQVNATHPHAAAPVGSRRMQKKSDALPAQ